MKKRTSEVMAKAHPQASGHAGKIEMERLLSIDEAADVLGVSPRTVLRYSEAEGLKRIALSARKTVFMRRDLEAFIQARRG